MMEAIVTHRENDERPADDNFLKLSLALRVLARLYADSNPAPRLVVLIIVQLHHQWVLTEDIHVHYIARPYET